MVRGWLPRFGAALLLLPGGRGEETTQQTGETEKERQELLPETAGSLRRPSLLPKSALSPPPPSPAWAARPGRRAPKAGSLGPGRVGGPRAPHVVRALPVPLLFSWAPRNPQLPRFHRPQLAPPPPRFSAMQLQGSLFPRLRSPTLPDPEGRRRAGGGGRRGRRGRPGQVSVPAAAAAASSLRQPPRQPCRPAPGEEAGGRAGEPRLGTARRRRRGLGVGAGNQRGGAWAPAARSPSRIGEFLISLERTSRQQLGRGRPGRDSAGAL